MPLLLPSALVAADVAEPGEGLPPDDEDEAEIEAAPEPFHERIKYISRTKHHPQQKTNHDKAYAFVVAGDVYIPGYMVKHLELRLGDTVYGTRRMATGARLPYRACSIDQHVSADDEEGEEGEDEEEEEALSDDGMPTLRDEDDAASDNVSLQREPERMHTRRSLSHFTPVCLSCLPVNSRMTWHRLSRSISSSTSNATAAR